MGVSPGTRGTDGEWSRLAIAGLILTALVACGSSGSNTVSSTPAPIPSSSSVPRTAVHFGAPDGVRIEGSVFGHGPVGAVLGHDLDGDQTEWWDFAQTLARSGYTALAIDYRGSCPGGVAGCSGDGSTAGAWKDMLGGVRYLKRHGVTKVVLIGSSMGGTASIVAAARPGSGVAGVISLSGPVQCCGLDAGKDVVSALSVPMLLIVGRLDAGFVGDTRQLGKWAGTSAQTVILPSGEHGVNLLRFATPSIQRRATSLVLAFMKRVQPVSTTTVWSSNEHDVLSVVSERSLGHSAGPVYQPFSSCSKSCRW
jgi:dienelactone hydrolase